MELLPIMPPSVARFDVEVSGPKPSPNRLAARLRSSCTTPGSTRTRRPSTSIASIAFMWREKSSTSPRPPAVCPARLVPPPRGTIGTPSRAQMRDRRGDVVGVTRERHGERLDREHARVAGEQMPRVGVVAHLARQLTLQRRRQLPRNHVRCLLDRRRAEPSPAVPVRTAARVSPVRASAFS